MTIILIYISTMKKIFSIIITSILFFSQVLAVNTYQAKISVLDDFDVRAAIDNMKDLQESVEEITSELYDLDKKETTDGQISQKYRDTRKEIVRVIQAINNTTDQVGSMLKKIAIYKKQIFLSQKELNNTKGHLESTKKYMQDFTNFMYKVDQNLYSDGADQINEVKLLLTSKNIPQTLASAYSVKSMILQFNQLLEELKKNETKQENLIKRLNKMKINTKNQVKRYDQELEKLQQKKNYLIHFLELYKNDRFRDKSTFENIFNSVKDVHTAVMSFIWDIEKGNYKAQLKMEEKIKELRSAEKNAPEENYPIAFPVYPVAYMPHGFNDQAFLKEFWVPHDGIEIAEPQGSPVYSARDGIVYHVVDNDGIGINWMLIVHNDWYITSYLYLNKILVEEWDVVRRGQIIGYSGWEPGTNGAGFVSDGSNLTFAVYKDGLAIDPLSVVDLSSVKDKELLPEKYHIKYLKDKFARPIDITELTFMEWNNVLQRANNFLELYGVGIYRQISFWEDAVEDTNIDRDVVACIAFAESTLWHHLTTSNNIGNVWNNDRWDRIGYVSPLAGARLIADTINNQHLGHYNTIKDLSRYGNKTWKIYASSTINRQTNVLKCLSQIKGYYVPEDFPFRTGPNPEL